MSVSTASALCGRDGALLCVSICVDPWHLESLLEALSQLSFPINPQIYHDAALVYRFADEHEEAESTTLVEFPAYESQLENVTGAVVSGGFDPGSVQVTGMLDEIQAQRALEPSTRGLGRYRIKHRAAVA